MERNVDDASKGMPIANLTTSQQIARILKLHNENIENPIFLGIESEFPLDLVDQLPKNVEHRILRAHGEVWLTCKESGIHGKSKSSLANSVKDSEYGKREHLDHGNEVFDVIHLHSCGCMQEKIADAVLSDVTGPYEQGRIYIEVAFHNEPPLCLIEELINGLSPFHTFRISIGMRINDISRDEFAISIFIFERTPSNPPARDDEDNRRAMKAESKRLQALKPQDYNPKQELKKFCMDNRQNFARDLGVILVGERFREVRRCEIATDWTLPLNSIGDTFTITSLVFQQLMNAYTRWWDGREEQRNERADQEDQ